MITKKDEEEYKKPKISKFWNVLIYGSFAAIGILLVFIYFGYVVINK